MKNFLSIFLVLSVLILNSCSNDIDRSSDIYSELKMYNAEYKYSENKNFHARSWWQSGLDALAVVGGDAAGAAAGVWAVQGLAGAAGAATAGTGYAVVATIGGVVGAAGGSWAAYCTVGGKHCKTKRVGKSNPDNKYGKSVKYNLPTPYSYINNFGIFHNDFLENVHLYNSTNLTELQWIVRNIPNANLIDAERYYSTNEFTIIINNIKKNSEIYASSEYDVNILLNSYKNNGYINENIKNVLSLYFTAISRASEFNDFTRITDYYVNTTIRSSFSKQEKESLLAAFAVSVQSYYYWLNFEPINQ
jgi:hypothetical protein